MGSVDGISPGVFCSSSLSAGDGGSALLEFVHQERNEPTPRRTRMLTAYFTVVTIAFFASIVVSAAVSVASIRLA